MIRRSVRLTASQQTKLGIEKAETNAKKFVALIDREQLPRPHREFRFHDTRQWRFDFAWPSYQVALESEGGSHARGRHTRGKGFAEDCVKYSEAAINGWLVLRTPASALCTQMTLDYVRRALAAREGPRDE